MSEPINEKSLTIEDIEREVREVYLLKDVGVIRVIFATIISNRGNLDGDPVWLLLMAGSSSGKTALLQLLDKCGTYIHHIDTLTTNTFASGLKRDTETSLLHKAKNGILVFKDFTTLTSMNEEGLREIMGQLRSIFDGSFHKKTGNDADVDFEGKIGVIAAGTIEVQRKMRQFSKQGERFVNYIMDVADSKEIGRRALYNQKGLKTKRESLADISAKFINAKLGKILDSPKDLPKKIEEKLIELTNFCTLARSPVEMNKKNENIVAFVGNREELPRVIIQLKSLAIALMVIADEKELSDLSAKIIYKVALDSIPVERRIVLRMLALYRDSTTKNMAMKLNYPSDTVRGWLNQVNALKLVDRQAAGGGDTWTLKKEFKDVLIEFEGLEIIDSPLEPTEEEMSNAYIDEVSSDDDKKLAQLRLDEF